MTYGEAGQRGYKASEKPLQRDVRRLATEDVRGRGIGGLNNQDKGLGFRA